MRKYGRRKAKTTLVKDLVAYDESTELEKVLKSMAEPSSSSATSPKSQPAVSKSSLPRASTDCDAPPQDEVLTNGNIGPAPSATVDILTVPDKIVVRDREVTAASRPSNTSQPPDSDATNTDPSCSHILHLADAETLKPSTCPSCRLNLMLHNFNTTTSKLVAHGGRNRCRDYIILMPPDEAKLWNGRTLSFGRTIKFRWSMVSL